MKTIEKSAQEALRAREEMIAVEAVVPLVELEATKVPLVAPLQYRVFPMT
jgi:hypothetical protein